MTAAITEAILAACVLAYAIALPLWLPPVLKARRSKSIEPARRRLAIWLATLSPLVAAIAFIIGNEYCRQGSRVTGWGEGAFWPQCDAKIAWLAILTPATAMGLTAWTMVSKHNQR